MSKLQKGQLVRATRNVLSYNALAGSSDLQGLLNPLNGKPDVFVVIKGPDDNKQDLPPNHDQKGYVEVENARKQQALLPTDLVEPIEPKSLH